MKRPFVLFFCFLQTIVAAQDINSFHYENEPLSVVLGDIESAYKVKFNYRSSSFKNVRVTLHTGATDLNGVLSILQSQLNIHIEKINARYYIIKPDRTITICGKIRDATDSRPIAESSVFIKSSDTGTVSNAEGFFRLEKVNRSDTLQISFIGYSTIELSVKSLEHEQCEVYELVREGYRLNEVVVHEYLAAGITRTRDGAIKIDPLHLNILSGLAEPDILQNAQLLPGIESPSETASGLFIRGGSPDQNLILWDGIKMYGSNHFFGMISAFNPYITKNVNVYRGGVKAEYGDRVSGVIDIGTDTEVPVDTEGGFGLNMTHADMYLKVPLSKKIGLLVSGRRSIKDLGNTSTFENFSRKVFQNTGITQNQEFFNPDFSDIREDFYFTDATLKLIMQPTGHDRISISNILTKNKLDYAYRDVDLDIASTDELDIQNFGTNMLWERTWSNRFSSRSQLSYSEYDHLYNGSDRYFEQDFSLTKKNVVKEFGANLHTDWHLNDQMTLSNGYQYFTNQVAYRFRYPDDEFGDNQNSPTHALYGHLNYIMPGKWYFDLGLRTNYYTKLNTLNVQPRFYAERLIGNHFRLKASAEVKSQAVSQIIEFATTDFGLENQIWALTSETDSPLLVSDQYSLGLLFLKNGWHLDVDAYYKRIDGLNSVTRGFESTEDFFSEGKSATKGIDLLLKKKINGYSTWLGYTYSVTDFSFDALNQGNAFRGNNDITHSLAWTHAYKWNGFQFSLGWKYHTGIPYSIPTGTTEIEEDTFIEYAAINDRRLPDYHRLDLSALYGFKLSKKTDAPIGKLGFSLLNLYGRDNLLSRSHTLFGTTDSNGEQTLQIGELNKFSLRTTPNVVLRVSF